MEQSGIIIPLVTIVFPLLGAGIGYLIKQNIENNKLIKSEVTKERRELYQHFVNLIMEIFSEAKTEIKQPDEEIVKKLYEFYKKYILYASPGVINSFSDYFQYLYATNSQKVTLDLKVLFTKLSKIMIEMRKDLGLINQDLGENGEKLFRAIITDFDEIMK